MTAEARRRIIDYIDARFDDEVRFLAELVKMPSDNPPGDCAAHAEGTAKLMEGLGFTVERHVVPQATVEAAGMITATNLVARRTYGIVDVKEIASKFGSTDLKKSKILEMLARPQGATASEMTAAGLKSVSVPTYTKELAEEYGLEWREAKEGRGTRSWIYKPIAGPVIALNAHGDVVPPGEGWTADPYGAEIRDGWMYGRGAAVSKSDFATYAFATLALEQAGVPLKGGIEIHGTYDEEVGGDIGPRWLIEQGISRPDLAIAAGFSYSVVTAHNGVLHLEAVIDGKSAHAAIPFTGIDALEAANGIMSALYAFRRSLATKVSEITGIGSPQLTLGLIKGGINTNVVPDRVTIRMDRRMIPEENPAEVEAELRAVMEGAAKAYPGIRLTVNRILLARPLVPLPGSERLAEALVRHAGDIMGERVETKGVPLYTDARHYAAAGIPIVLYGAGPRTITEANAHRADERLPIEDLRRATKVVALALLDLLAQ
jgi:acetylornithine deacetylase/succinyl-diaminopimelate desuccinylase-like protein